MEREIGKERDKEGGREGEREYVFVWKQLF